MTTTPTHFIDDLYTRYFREKGSGHVPGHTYTIASVPGSLPYACAIFMYDLWTPCEGGEARKEATYTNHKNTLVLSTEHNFGY